MIKALLISLGLLFGSVTFAAADKTTTKEKTPAYPEMTAEMRSKMAEMHQQMATCLKSEKSFEDCRSEMTTSCQEFGHMMPMGPGMMGGRGMMMGGRRGHMMGGYPGMMTGFCGDKWIQEKETTKTKTKK